MISAQLFSLVISLISAPAPVRAAQISDVPFCSIYAEHLQELALDARNLLAFENDGGIPIEGLGGVCWWHSRLQRAALYLTEYRPDVARPNADGAAKIVDALIAMDSVVQIPGYANFRDFSADYRAIIQKKLDSWQNSEAAAAVRMGASGDSETTPENLKKLMDALYESVNAGAIEWQMLQEPGIVAHAWLVVKMKRVEGGYDLKIIDSNAPQSPQDVRYRVGQRQVEYNGDKFVPYTGFRSELRRILNARALRCTPGLQQMQVRPPFWRP
jgi:hypothetical protein